MWRAARIAKFGRNKIRRLSSAVFHDLAEEGHWRYSSEWWGEGGADGQTVFRSTSEHGNGIVSVITYPSSRPLSYAKNAKDWPAVEAWLLERYAKIHPGFNHEVVRILGYQWRVLRFNDNTRQSTVKIMAAYREADPASLYLMQQTHCLAVPYLKSMVSAGLTALLSSGFDISSNANGSAIVNVLCIGQGGGSLPLFLATKLKGSTVDIVEIDPVVISASVEAMGFPASAAAAQLDRPSAAQLSDGDKLLWGDLHERLHLYRSDADDFVDQCSKMYDLIFIDAYDGDDVFSWKLWDADSPFLGSLRSRLHPVHGIVVVNLHGDSDEDLSVLPMGKYIDRVCRAYKERLGFAFVISVPWLCNYTLVASSGVGMGIGLSRDSVLGALLAKSSVVENLLDLPFSCLQYIKRGFQLVS